MRLDCFCLTECRIPVGIVFQEALLIGSIAEGWAYSSLECPDIVEASGTRNNVKKQTQAEPFKVVGMDSIGSYREIAIAIESEAGDSLT